MIILEVNVCDDCNDYSRRILAARKAGLYPLERCLMLFCADHMREVHGIQAQPQDLTAGLWPGKRVVVAGKHE